MRQDPRNPKLFHIFVCERPKGHKGQHGSLSTFSITTLSKRRASK
jgi:hypothetical protein